jgi:branched-chain amino acid transport system substrate-binding protein
LTEEDLVSEEQVKSLDRGAFLKRAGAGAAVAGAATAFPQGVWAGITKTAARKPLRIGNLLTLSGPNSAPPIDIKRGFAAYVKSRNGIGGRKIQFIDADDGNNPAQAIQQVQKLASDGVDVIEGIFFSSILLGVRDTIDQLKIPTVVANAAANAISRDRKSDYIYRTSYSN